MTLAAANVSQTSSDTERHPTRWSLQATWADSEADMRAAQALRFNVFAAELGAQLPAAAVASGLDADRFDPYCDHLLVRAVDPFGEQPPKLVGTYRVLPPDAARLLGGLYAEQEFDLSPLDSLRPRMVELGRACVHADWRSGGAILMLWSALGRYMIRRQLDTMTGCASIGLADGGQFAAAVWHSLESNHLAVPRWRVTPHTPLALCALDPEAVPLSIRALPPLIKGYLRGGACVLGAPAYDPYFRTADFPIMMQLADLTPRYRAQFLLP